MDLSTRALRYLCLLLVSSVAGNRNAGQNAGLPPCCTAGEHCFPSSQQFAALATSIKGSLYYANSTWHAHAFTKATTIKDKLYQYVPSPMQAT